jgi:hypothetical protein
VIPNELAGDRRLRERITIQMMSPARATTTMTSRIGVMMPTGRPLRHRCRRDGVGQSAAAARRRPSYPLTVPAAPVRVRS